MGRHSTIPDLIEDLRTISISDLKKWGYLEGKHFKGGVISWSRNGTKTGSINITVDTYLELDYT